LAVNSNDRIESARLDTLRQQLYAPVMSLAGYAELLQGWMAQEDLVDWQDDLARIDTATDQLRALTVDLLDAEVMGGLSGEELEARRSVIRHDMRNALGAITGYSEIMMEDLDESGLLQDEGRTYLNQLLQESNNLLITVDTLISPDRHKPAETGRADEIASIFESFAGGIERGEDELTLGRILVVDDNESNRNLLAHQLTREGHTALLAASGREALDMMAADRPDLLLLDLLMPEMNGFEVLQRMRMDAELRSIPVIVITGLHDNEGVVRCIEAGAQDYLTKPVNPVILRARISACLERKGWLDKEREYQRDLEKSHAFIRKVFGRYLSDDIVKQILDAEDGLNMGGGRQQVTIMMTDIRGFTKLSQQLEPEDVVRMLNNYLGTMSSIIIRHGGTIDEFIGDAILAIWGAPLVREDDAERAVACALEMQLAMEEVNQRNVEMGLPVIHMGIGLNTGNVVVGNIGSEVRSKYGVVGHHVNLTARIESFTVGGQIMASEFTVNAVGEKLYFGQCLEVDAKGLSHTINIYEVVGLGEPWNVVLPSAAEEFHHLPSALEVHFQELSDKAIDGDLVGAEIYAVSEGAIKLRTSRSVELMTNLRVIVRRDHGPEEGELYAKVTRVYDEAGDWREYRVTITQIPDPLREFMLSRRAGAEAV